VACTAAPLDPHRIGEHPGARHWTEEFGDPSDPAVRAAMDDYSPFERARRFPGGRWPRFLLTTFAEDSRVAAAPTDRLAAALTARGAEVVRSHRPRMGHGGNHLDAVHDFAASVLDFALDSAHVSTGV
ncbi:prolyl oligopeptidase family serine peptidase, partial [Nocardioides sp. NPDC000441]